MNPADFIFLDSFKAGGILFLTSVRREEVFKKDFKNLFIPFNFQRIPRY